MYVRSILQEKTQFLLEHPFWLVALAFYYDSCFNASIAGYTLQIYFVFEKLIQRK